MSEQKRVLVVHKYVLSPWSYKLCEPLGCGGREGRDGLASSEDGKVTCKHCLKKMMVKKMRGKVEVVGGL